MEDLAAGDVIVFEWGRCLEEFRVVWSSGRVVKLAWVRQPECKVLRTGAELRSSGATYVGREKVTVERGWLWSAETRTISFLPRRLVYRDDGDAVTVGLSADPTLQG